MNIVERLRFKRKIILWTKKGLILFNKRISLIAWFADLDLNYWRTTILLIAAWTCRDYLFLDTFWAYFMLAFLRNVLLIRNFCFMYIIFTVFTSLVGANFILLRLLCLKFIKENFRIWYTILFRLVISPHIAKSTYITFCLFTILLMVYFTVFVKPSALRTQILCFMDTFFMFL